MLEGNVGIVGGGGGCRLVLSVRYYCHFRLFTAKKVSRYPDNPTLKIS
jgi:hypothetical protein